MQSNMTNWGGKMVYKNGMQVWYVIVYTENDTYKIYEEEGELDDGTPISEPKFFEDFESAHATAEAEYEDKEWDEWEIYERVE